MSKIDIVLPWVDGNDPEWQAEKEQFLHKKDRNEHQRFRDWDNLQYVFRGIEKYMPWVNKVYFITWGHLPSWLNVNHPKLVIVNHKDFIPSKYLPTFNSNTIDLNVFKIKGLSEQYILFNDDTFVIHATEETDFFKEGLPCDLACISPQPVNRDIIASIELNNLMIINSHFSPKDVRANQAKWLHPLYGTLNLRTLMFMRFKTIIGIFVPHLPISHLKSTVQELWKIEYEAYDSTCQNKFRTQLDINDWLSREWQLLSGNFFPRSKKFGYLCGTTEKERIQELLALQSCKIVCINDDLNDNALFEKTKNGIIKLLNHHFPDKCSYEI